MRISCLSDDDDDGNNRSKCLLRSRLHHTKVSEFESKQFETIVAVANSKWLMSRCCKVYKERERENSFMMLLLINNQRQAKYHYALF